MINLEMTKEFMGSFDFNKTYVGIVLDNKDFEINYKLKIYIPELFGSLNNAGVAFDYKETLSVEKLAEYENLILSNTIVQSNYLECLPEVKNSDLEYIDDFIRTYKAEIGSYVKVSFVNGNPLSPYYNNTIVLKENQLLNMFDGSSKGRLIEGENYNKDSLYAGDIIFKRTNSNYNLEGNNYILNLVENGKFKKDTEIPFPNPPEIEGYTFQHWDPDITKVSNSLYKEMLNNGTVDDGITFEPIYKKNTYLVKFTNIDGKIIKVVSIEYGDSISLSKEPDVTIDGKTFYGWDKDLTNITENIIVSPIYDKEVCKVIYKDSFDNILKIDILYKGALIKPPDPPEIEGYETDGWDIADNLLALENMILYLKYYKNTLPIIIKDNKGNILKKFRDDSLIPLSGGSGSIGIFHQDDMPDEDKINDGDLWLTDCSSSGISDLEVSFKSFE